MSLRNYTVDYDREPTRHITRALKKFSQEQTPTAAWVGALPGQSGFQNRNRGDGGSGGERVSSNAFGNCRQGRSFNVLGCCSNDRHCQPTDVTRADIDPNIVVAMKAALAVCRTERAR